VQALPDERFEMIVCRYAVFLYLTWEQVPSVPALGPLLASGSHAAAGGQGAAILRQMVEHCMAPGCV
jgi:hypothetical protein